AEAVGARVGDARLAAGRDDPDGRADQDDRGRNQDDQRRHLHLVRLDLLAQVFRRASYHESGDEHGDDGEDEHPVEARADAAVDDLTELHQPHRDEPTDRCVRVVHGVDGPVRRRRRRGGAQLRVGHAEADRLGAPWIAAYVETPQQTRLPQAAHDGVIQTMRLAEQLGAQTMTLSGQRMSEEILAYAHTHNVTKLIVGKPTRGLWKRIFIGSIVDALVQGSGDIDVYVISGEREPTPAVTPVRQRAIPTDWVAYARAVVALALATGV